MHPDFLIQLNDKDAKHSDTIYNDTWSYVLLIGRILDKNIKYTTTDVELKFSGPAESMKFNLEQVQQAIQDSQLSTEAKAVLNTNINILAPEHIPADTKPYEHRGQLIKAIQAIQGIVLEERVALEAKEKSIAIGEKGVLSKADLETGFPKITLMSAESENALVQEIFKFAQQQNKKIDESILQDFLTQKLTKNPSKIHEILKILRSSETAKTWCIDQPAVSVAPQSSGLPQPLLHSYRTQNPTATELSPAKQAALSLEQISTAIQAIPFQKGFSEGCIQAISAASEKNGGAKIDETNLIKALKNIHENAPSKAATIVAQLREKGLMMEAPPRSESFKIK